MADNSPLKTPKSARTLRRARSLFLEGGSVPQEHVRGPILDSWQRSLFWGVDTDRIECPYDPDFDPRSKLAMASAPVLDRLAEVLSDTPVSLILTDSKGRIRERRTGDQVLDQHLDDINLAPGFSYAEEYVGTNGIGTAVEDGKPVQVFGPEHFSERLQRVSCAGAPVFNPTSGRVIGLVDITCWRTTASPMMVALARQAAADIEERLLQLGSERERALLHEFMSSGRSAGRALVTVSDGLLIADSSAAELLTPDDHRMLRERIGDLDSGQDHLLTLSDGRTVKARSRSVTVPGGHAPSGHVVEIRTVNRTPGDGTVPMPAPTPRLPRLAGRSPSWRTSTSRVFGACRDGQWGLVEGEAGTGKHALVRAVHEELRPSEPFSLHDAAEIGRDTASWFGALQRELARDRGTVVIRHLERLPNAAVTPLVRHLTAAEGRTGWVVGLRTLTAGSGALPQPASATNTGAVEQLLAKRVSIAPLRLRSEDVTALVLTLVARLAKKAVECSEEFVRTLSRAPWPGNVRQLEGTLRYALAQCDEGRLHTGNLPSSLLSRAQHPLTTWETTERDLIIQALLDHDGDKAEAARTLGISRATIYRKIAAYQISFQG